MRDTDIVRRFPVAVGPADGFLTATGTILNITYGYNVKDCDDPLVTLADECTSASVAAGGPGALLCDLVPACMLPDGVLETVVTLLGSEILANVGALFRVQEACAVYQIPCGKILRRTVPIRKGSDGTSSYCDLVVGGR